MNADIFQLGLHVPSYNEHPRDQPGGGSCFADEQTAMDHVQLIRFSIDLRTRPLPVKKYENVAPVKFRPTSVDLVTWEIFFKRFHNRF